MLRLLLALAGLLASGAAAPFAYHAAPTLGAAGGAPPAPAGHVLDASALPGATGWFLTPFEPDRETLVTIDGTWHAATQRAGAHGAALVVAFPGEGAHVISLSMSTMEGPTELDVHGRSVSCCSVDGLGGASGAGHPRAEGYAAPGRPVWIGVVADAWDAGSDLRLSVTPQKGALQQGAPLVGTNVAAFDLLRLAREDGTQVRLGSTPLAGSSGTARVERVPSGTAFLAIAVVASGTDEATLHVRLPNGTPVPGHIVRSGDAMVTAMKRGGLVSFGVSDVREESWAESLRHKRDDPVSYVTAVALYADMDAVLDGYGIYLGSFNDDGSDDGPRA